jgi:hypothetical protein
VTKIQRFLSSSFSFAVFCQLLGASGQKMRAGIIALQKTNNKAPPINSMSLS